MSYHGIYDDDICFGGDSPILDALQSFNIAIESEKNGDFMGYFIMRFRMGDNFMGYKL